jgi:hydrogenase expression/formation protein HypC
MLPLFLVLSAFIGVHRRLNKMCLGIPMQVVEIEGVFAICDSRNGRSRINTMLVGDVQPGQWLLTFLDAAREIIDAERAALVNAALDALSVVADGGSDFDACFADLIGREPQLPDFLRKDQT